MPDTSFQVYLASQSPRRMAILSQMGLKYSTIPIEIDEISLNGESPSVFTERMAVEKAFTGRKIARSSETPVVGCDTCISLDGKIIGKPQNKAHAFEILQSLSGRQHEVVTAVAICNEFKTLSLVQLSMVNMRKINNEEIETYWASGEPLDKAGAYAIQGLGALFIRYIEGSYSGVMGLPIYETAQLLKEFGIDCMQSKINYE